MTTIEGRWKGRSACIALLNCLVFVLLPLTACGPASSKRAGPAEAEISPPQRIISLSPDVTEILDGVGAFDRVIAVSDYCDYPPAAKRLPRVGGWQTTCLEQVNALQPDLVIMTRSQAPFVETRLRALGFETLIVDSLTLEDAVRSIDQIGRATGNEAEAESLVRQVQSSLDAVKATTQHLSRPKVLCVVDRVPGTLRDLYTATEGSFLAQVIEIAGGHSIAPPAAEGYAKISKEAVVTLNPEVIIDMVQAAKGRFAENPASVWQELSDVSAVHEGRIYPLRDTSVLHPSQFVAATARRFAHIIHPEAFQDAANP